MLAHLGPVLARERARPGAVTPVTAPGRLPTGQPRASAREVHQRRRIEPSRESEVGRLRRFPRRARAAPSSQVVRDHLHREPRPVRVVQPDAVFEVTDRVLDLGVTAMVGLQLQQLPGAIGDEGVVTIVRKEREL